MRSPAEVFERIRQSGRETDGAGHPSHSEGAEHERDDARWARQQIGVVGESCHGIDHDLMRPERTPAGEHEEESNLDLDRHYGQWYEVDPRRFDLERKAMEELGFSCGRLRDGRICFVRDPGESNAFALAVVCDWSHPLKPPSVFAEGDKEVLDRIRKLPDGGFDLSCVGCEWRSGLAAATVVEWFESRVEILSEPGS